MFNFAVTVCNPFFDLLLEELYSESNAFATKTTGRICGTGER